MRKVSTRAYLVYRSYQRISPPGLSTAVYVEKHGLERREKTWSQLRSCFLPPPVYIPDEREYAFKPVVSSYVTLWVECGHDANQYVRRLTDLLDHHVKSTKEALSRSQRAVSGTEEIRQRLQRARFYLVDQRSNRTGQNSVSHQYDDAGNRELATPISQANTYGRQPSTYRRVQHRKKMPQLRMRRSSNIMTEKLKVEDEVSGDHSDINGSLMLEILRGYRNAIENHEF